MSGLKDLRRVWNRLGATDPYWAILSDPLKKGNGWAVDDFFETGRREIAALMAYLARVQPQAGRERALDFGCGAGRLTQALAEHYREVDGVDIAPSMVALAWRHNRYPDRCRYHVNDAGDLSLFKADAFDVVYSNITLQHMEPRFAKRYIAEFVRVLRPGGVAVFQLPSLRKAEARTGRGASIRRRLSASSPRFVMAAYRTLRTRLDLLSNRAAF